MNIPFDKKRYPSALPHNWQRLIGVGDEPSPRRSHQNQVPQQPAPVEKEKADAYYYKIQQKNNASLVPPIRQTASIFKQPVTIFKMQEGSVKETKSGVHDKPKQLFWEKRLEGLRACDTDGYEFSSMDLPKALKPVGPYVTEETLLQSVATALHVSSKPVTGQMSSRSSLEKNAGVYLNPEQPLMQAILISDDDIRKQEEKVNNARKRLQDALQSMYA